MKTRFIITFVLETKSLVLIWLLTPGLGTAQNKTEKNFNTVTKLFLGIGSNLSVQKFEDHDWYK